MIELRPSVLEFEKFIKSQSCCDVDAQDFG